MLLLLVFRTLSFSCFDAPYGCRPFIGQHIAHGSGATHGGAVGGQTSGRRRCQEREAGGHVMASAMEKCMGGYAECV